MKVKQLVWLAIVLVLSACTEAESIRIALPSQTTITETLLPTSTMTVPSQTETPLPTTTPEPSVTLRPTSRPTRTYTPTPVYESIQEITDQNANVVQELLELRSPSNGFLTQLEFSPTKNTLIAAYSTDGLYLWEFPTLKNAISLQDVSQGALSGGGDAFALSRDGKVIATSGFCGIVDVMEFDTNQVMLELAEQIRVNHLIFGKDSSKLIISGYDREIGREVIEIWDIVTNQRVAVLDDFPLWYGPICSLAISPSGKILAAGFCDYHNEIWDLSAGYKSLGMVLGMYGPNDCLHFCDSYNTIQFKPRSNILASGTNNPGIPLRDIFTSRLDGILSTNREVEFEDPDTGEVKIMIWGPDVLDMAFSPDGTVLAIATWSEVQLRSTKTGELLSLLEFPEFFPNEIAFSVDGYLLAAGSTDGTIIVYGILE